MLTLTVLVLILMTSQAVTSNNYTSFLEKTFRDRCSGFIDLPATQKLPRIDFDCDSLWQEFTSAFRYAGPCGVLVENYRAFLNSTVQETPRNQAMFWSGVKVLVHDFVKYNRQYITLEDTLSGYLPDDLTWCPTASEPGYQDSQCPEFGSCEGEAQSTFWTGASKQFAQLAHGQVNVMLSGTNPARTAYSRKSYFGGVELPNMQSDRVTKVKVFLINERDKMTLETCDSGSLLELKEDVAARNFEYECVENPPEYQCYVSCSQDPNCNACHSSASSTALTSLWNVILATVVCHWML